MDEIDNGPLSLSQVVNPTTIIVTAAVTFSVVVVGKLGYDWVKEGIRTIKAKKNQTA